MTVTKPKPSPSRVVGPPTLRWERRAWEAGNEFVAGVDEVGRGAWAGPLTAAAVLVPRDPRARARLTRALNQGALVPKDSKQLSHSQRERVVDVLRRLGVPIAIADIAPAQIDALGLGVANRQAMLNAVAALDPAPEHVLVDAFRLHGLPCTHEAIVKGDAHCLSIALASIVAKTHRDGLMASLGSAYPEYGFAEHKGYGTAAHAAALARLGVTEQHRRSFAPIAELLASDE